MKEQTFEHIAEIIKDVIDTQLDAIEKHLIDKVKTEVATSREVLKGLLGLYVLGAIQSAEEAENEKAE